MGYNWPVAFSAALIIHLGIPFRLHWHSLAGWIQSHGRSRNTVHGMTLGDGFRAVRTMELRSRMRWWHVKTWYVFVCVCVCLLFFLIHIHLTYDAKVGASSTMVTDIYNSP